ncbi:MAG: L,D-transpeptidase [Acidobacteriota bacterium]
MKELGNQARQFSLNLSPVAILIGAILIGPILIGTAIGFSASESIDRPLTGSAAKRLGAARQMVLVITPEWNSVDGRLSRYERVSGGRTPWRQVGQSIPVVVGKNGLGWAAEFADWRNDPEPVKREGDGRSPAGLFSLGSAFGYAPASELGRLAIDYLQVTKNNECVDDCQSGSYNQLVDGSRHPHRDWQSSEIMRRDDEYYRLGVVINHNLPRPVPCQGSCIFLHIWEGPGIGTVGCTAMAPEPMLEIVKWLDQSRKPVIVQLTEAEKSARRWLP